MVIQYIGEATLESGKRDNNGEATWGRNEIIAYASMAIKWSARSRVEFTSCAFVSSGPFAHSSAESRSMPNST